MLGDAATAQGRRSAAVAVRCCATLCATASTSRADEGGVSFWRPGTYGSLSAIPAVPGWSFLTFNYYDSVSASKDVGFVRDVRAITPAPLNHELPVISSLQLAGAVSCRSTLEELSHTGTPIL
jgi:hypothetical protein